MHDGHIGERAERKYRPIESVGVSDVERWLSVVDIQKDLKEKLTLPPKGSFNPGFGAVGGLEICGAKLSRLDWHLHQAHFACQFGVDPVFEARPLGGEEGYLVASPR